MAEGAGKPMNTRRNESPERNVQEPGLARAHDRRMASTGAGGEITVELVALAPTKPTGKGGRFMSLDARMPDDRNARKEVTLWNEAADEFQRRTSFLKLSGQQPLTVTFRGAFRKRGVYCAERNTRLETWIFNAKDFEIDWLSPAGRAAHQGKLTLHVASIEERTSSVSKQSYLVASGLDPSGCRHRVALHGEARDALMNLPRTTSKPGATIATVELDGAWRMTRATDKSTFRRSFTAKKATIIETVRQPLSATRHSHIEAHGRT